MSASAPTRPDERYKREQCFRCPERARISWGRAMRRQVRGRDLRLSRSGQRHIDAPWRRKFNQGPYGPLTERRMVLYATQPNTLSPADPCNKVPSRTNVLCPAAGPRNLSLRDHAITASYGAGSCKSSCRRPRRPAAAGYSGVNAVHEPRLGSRTPSRVPALPASPGLSATSRNSIVFQVEVEIVPAGIPGAAPCYGVRSDLLDGLPRQCSGDRFSGVLTNE